VWQTDWLAGRKIHRGKNDVFAPTPAAGGGSFREKGRKIIAQRKRKTSPERGESRESPFSCDDEKE
jgi:hypothetical protein